MTINHTTASFASGDRTAADSPASIIVLTREHIGDLVCTTPALRSLRRLYPQAHIAVEVGERAVCVLENNPNVDEIIPRPTRQGISGKWNFVRLLRKRKFDLAVILDDSTDMPLTVWLGGVRRRVGLVRKKRFARLLTDPVPYDINAHEMIDNFRNVVGALGGDVSDPRPEVFPTAVEKREVDQMLQDAGVRAGECLIALNPATSVPSRNWLPERFSELGNLLSDWPDVRLLLLGGPGDRARAQIIVSGMKTPPILLTGYTSVMQQAELQSRCALLISGNTGPMHLACATGTPVIALIGLEDPRDYGPEYVPGNVVIRKVSGCPGCTWTKCIRQNACMRLITAEEVAEAAERLLKRRSLSLTAKEVSGE